MRGHVGASRSIGESKIFKIGSGASFLFLPIPRLLPFLQIMPVTSLNSSMCIVWYDQFDPVLQQAL